MNDIDLKLRELREGTSGLKAPEGFDGRLALALVAAPASAAVTVLGLKFKTLLGLLAGAGVVAGAVAVALDSQLPTPPAEQRVAPSLTREESAPTAPQATGGSRVRSAPVEAPMLQRLSVPPSEAAPPPLPASAFVLKQGASTSVAPAARPAAVTVDLTLPPPPVAVWPAPGCGRARPVVLEPKEPLEVAQGKRAFPDSLRTLLALPHGPLVVGRLQARLGSAEADGRAFGTEVTVLENGWFVVSRRALPVWVAKHGFDPVKLTASDDLPTETSSFVGELAPFRQAFDVANFEVRGDVQHAHAVIEVAALPCGADRSATPHPVGTLELEEVSPNRAVARMVGLAHAPYLATLRGEGLLEERVVFEPSLTRLAARFTIEPLLDFDVEYLVVSTAAVGATPHTLEHASANAPFFIGTQHPLQLSQRAGQATFETTGTEWRGADTERTGRLVDAKVTLGGLGPLKGVLQPGQMYLLQDGPTFVLVRFTLRR